MTCARKCLGEYGRDDTLSIYVIEPTGKVSQLLYDSCVPSARKRRAAEAMIGSKHYCDDRENAFKKRV